MKTKAPVSTKKQSVTVRDLKTRKNPKGGTPAGKTTGGLAMDTDAWLAVIGGAAVATRSK